MLTLNLGGTAWTLQRSGQTEKIPAQVPGEHYSDLLRAGKIPDPYYRDNNRAVQWAAKAGWTYQRTFEATPEQLAMKHVELVCHGLDNFVHLEPGTPVSINVDCGQEHSAEDFQGQLAVRSVREFITPGIALPLVPPTSSSSSPKPQPAPATSTVGTGR